jgi:light-regulated signal transduction histidine kinase (bacteriophytochrome)
MSSLIDDLLRLSRIGRQNLQYSTVQLSAMAEAIMAELRAKAPERSVSASIEPGMSVVADRALMEVLLANLFSNAWKFTLGRPAASIAFRAEIRNGETIYCVEDDGIGFDMRYADKLFIPFQRLHAPKDYEGSGIGLSIVKRIIERHGGRIWAESEPDRGARFSFTLDGQARNE